MTTPFLAANWKPYKSEENLALLLQQLENTPLYLAVPHSLLNSLNEKPESLLVGSNTLKISPGSFTEQIAWEVFKTSGAHFALLDSGKQSIEEIQRALQALLASDRHAFLLIRDTESIGQFLTDLPQEKLEHLIIIDVSQPKELEGFDVFAARQRASCKEIRFTLENVLGEENGKKIRVLATLPEYAEDASPFIRNSPFDGFFLPDLAFQTELLFKTLGAIPPPSSPSVIIEEPSITIEEEVLIEKTLNVFEPSTPIKPRNYSDLTSWGH